MLQEKWNRADNVQKQKILSEMRGRVKQAKDNIVFEQAKKDEIRETNNENLLDSFMEKIDNGTATIKDVKSAKWEGKSGFKIRDTLIDKITDSYFGRINTDSEPNIYKGIQKKIEDGEIKSIDTVFQLPGESKGISLMDRINITVYREDLNYLRSWIKDVAKAPINL